MTHDQWTSVCGAGGEPLEPVTDALLDRYLAGESTPHERLFVERALLGAGNDAALVSLVRAWQGGVTIEAELDDARVRIARRLGAYPLAAVSAPGAAVSAAPGVASLTSRRARHIAPPVRLGRWAAGVAAATAIAGAAFLTREMGPGKPASGRVYATSSAQRAVLTLDDGTRVTLAPNTTLRIVAFDGHRRGVSLDGEAYFDVRNTAGAPFVVWTGSVQTRVLGTAFAVRRYAGDAGVRVAVRSGKVEVAASGRRAAVTLTAGRGAAVTDSTVTAASPEDVNAYTSWVDGRLVFHNAPAPDVFATLSRWYGYEFRLADSSIAKQKLTASLSTESSQAALATIKLLLNVDLMFDGKMVTLTPRRSGAAAPRYRRDAIGDMTSPNSEVGR